MLIAGLVLLAALSLYLPALEIGFLSDDFLDLEHSFDPGTFTRFEAGGFRPLTVAVWAFDSAVYGPGRAWGWHLTNLLLHLLCASALILLLRSLGLRPRGLLAAAALFLLSPAVIPSAARVSGRTTIIALLPLLLAFRLHVRWERGRRRSILLLAGAQLLYLGSLLAKETALLAPLCFAGLSLYLAEDDRGRIRKSLQALALYLLPVAVYAAWRLLAVGLALGYGESARFGPFMLKNATMLVRMTVSPWLDGIPLRILLLLALAAVLALHRHWRKLVPAALLVLPLVLTVSNLPPRSYYAYAALPGAALCAGLAADRLAGWRWSLVLAVLLAGCFLEARDELGRLRAADAYTETTTDHLAGLARTHPDMLIAVSGIREGVADYGTLWPGAYREALITRGIHPSTPPVRAGRMWEAAHVAMRRGEMLTVLFADLSATPAKLDTFSVDSRLWGSSRLPDTTLSIGPHGIGVDEDLWRYNSCRVWPAGPDSRLLLVSGEDACNEIAPHHLAADSAFFDLESTPTWLINDLPFRVFCGDAAGDSVMIRFSFERIYLDELQERIDRKRMDREASGQR